MADIFTLEKQIKLMIDELKGLSATNGLANQASEEVVITSVFLYKFLNDKFMSNLREFAADIDMSVDEILKNENDEMDAFFDTYPQDVAFKYEDTIEYLINRVSSDTFYKKFDDALERISNYPQNEEFSVQSAEGTRKPLFTRITENVESSKRNNFAKNIFGIISQERNMSPVEDKIYEVHDPSAGSGSLVLHLANELGRGSFGDKAQVYTQDISGKSTRFLRINMLLNGLTNSLDNIIEGDTLDTPAHYNIPHDPSSGVKRFDYITSNPPFKMDFSSTRNLIENKWENSEERDGIKRFFAGVPKIPNKKKESMAVYLCFMQHILWSLKDNGKAAVVCPTGFLTAKSGIEKEIRTKIIDKKWTGTNVSVLFIDKGNQSGDIMLIDASKLGKKVKDGKNQRTVLSDAEVKRIEDTFINQDVIDDFSVKVSYDDIKNKGYSFSAGQYFEVKIEYVDITAEEFEVKMGEYKCSLSERFKKSHELEEEITKKLGDIIHD